MGLGLKKGSACVVIDMPRCVSYLCVGLPQDMPTGFFQIMWSKGEQKKAPKAEATVIL